MSELGELPSGSVLLMQAGTPTEERFIRDRVGGPDQPVVSFGPPGAPALWLYADERLAHSLLHVAFNASSRSAVDAFHRTGLASGGRDNGAPGLRRDYSPSYYAAFLLDPDGNNIEAVCHSPG